MLKRFIIAKLVLISFLTAGCITPIGHYNWKIRRNSDLPLEERLKKSQNLIERRKKQAYSFTLAEKAVIFEAEREFFRLPPPYDSFQTRSINGFSSQSISTTPSFISENLYMLVFKFAVTRDKFSEQEANKILELLLRIDDQFGKKGQVPASIQISPLSPNQNSKNSSPVFIGKISSGYVYLSDDSHANNLSSFVIAAYLSYNFFEDWEVKEKSAEFLRRIISYLLDEKFILKKLDGSPSTYGNASGNAYLGFDRNAKAARLAFLEAAKSVLNDWNDPHDRDLLRRINNDLNQLEDCGFPKIIESIQFGILNLSFTTSTAHFRLFRNLYILNSAAGNSKRINNYRNALHYQWPKVRESGNSFLIFLYLSLLPKEQWIFDDYVIKGVAIEYLKSHPLDRDSSEVLNSFFDGNEEVNISSFSTVYKLKPVPQNKKPLPIYRRGVRSNEWALDQYRLNENEGNGDDYFENPSWFLTVYYSGLAFGFIPLEEQKVDGLKVAEYLKDIIPEFEKRKFPR